jgi:hypothetical protein
MQNISNTNIMKLTNNFLAMALTMISSVAMANNETSLSKNPTFDDEKKNTKYVNYADSSLIKAELAGLTKYSKTTVDKLSENDKIIEKPLTHLESLYVNYTDENIFDSEISINEIVTANNNNNRFVSYPDTSLLNKELGLLKNKKNTTTDKVNIDTAIIEAKNSNATLKLNKNLKAKKRTVIILNSRKYTTY